MRERRREFLFIWGKKERGKRIELICHKYGRETKQSFNVIFPTIRNL